MEMFSVMTSSDGINYDGCYNYFGYGSAYSYSDVLVNYQQFKNIKKISFNYPLTINRTRPYNYFQWSSFASGYSDEELLDLINIRLYRGTVNMLDFVGLYDVEDNEEVKLRDVVSAYYELNCLFGKVDRVSGLFYGEELNEGGLVPSNSLYPSSGLFPSGASTHLMKSQCSSLVSSAPESFRYLIIEYMEKEENMDDNGNIVYEWQKNKSKELLIQMAQKIITLQETGY